MSDDLYPCDGCGKGRTKEEGGKIFTYCDACWEKREAARKASAKPVNQCDGCQAGYPVEGGIHSIPYPSGLMTCEKDRYGARADAAHCERLLKARNEELIAVLTEGLNLRRPTEAAKYVEECVRKFRSRGTTP